MLRLTKIINRLRQDIKAKKIAIAEEFIGIAIFFCLNFFVCSDSQLTASRVYFRAELFANCRVNSVRVEKVKKFFNRVIRRVLKISFVDGIDRN